MKKHLRRQAERERRDDGYWSVPRIFDGETVVILGGGSSLTAAQIRTVAMARLDGRCRVVAVNDTVYLAWWADWLHVCDRKWWLYHKDACRFLGIKTTLEDGLPIEWGVHRLKHTGNDGFDPDPGHVRTGSNGVYQVIHSMIHAGARRIGLLGVDMSGRHWFGHHPEEIARQLPKLEHFAPRFATLLPELNKRGVKVVNCSPGSKLGVFESDEIEEFLRMKAP